jgi:hypothetical protein
MFDIPRPLFSFSPCWRDDRYKSKDLVRFSTDWSFRMASLLFHAPVIVKAVSLYNSEIWAEVCNVIWIQYVRVWMGPFIPALQFCIVQLWKEKPDISLNEICPGWGLCVAVRVKVWGRSCVLPSALKLLLLVPLDRPWLISAFRHGWEVPIYNILRV